MTFVHGYLATINFVKSFSRRFVFENDRPGRMDPGVAVDANGNSGQLSQPPGDHQIISLP